jgi:predicted phage terminase large subunit-like protein
MYPRYQPQWYHQLLAHYLEAVERGEITRLLVTFPPRHGKSELISVHFPAWYLGRNPDKRVIGTSYAAALAHRFSGRARNLFADSRWPFPVELSGDSQSKESWDIAGHRGGYVSAGVGGAITGHGAHVAFIDDPVKNAEEAESETIRESVWDWYTSTFYTRLEEGGAIVLVMTRWHEDDLAGRLLRMAKEDEDADQWTVLNLPAIAEEDEPWWRKAGEALWPDKYPIAKLERIRKTIGSRYYDALYQQRPSAAEGGILKRQWWRYWREMPPFDYLFQSWDMTFKDTKGSDYVVGQVWGVSGVNAYLVDQVRDRLDFPATVKAVLDVSQRWREAGAKLIEDKANGPAVISTLAASVPGLIPVEPEGSKMARASAVSWYVEGGNVYLPDPKLTGYGWVDDFVTECASFPHGAHDDQVDAMSQALARVVLGFEQEETMYYEDRVTIGPRI